MRRCVGVVLGLCFTKRAVLCFFSRVPYLAITKTFERIEEESKRYIYIYKYIAVQPLRDTYFMFICANCPCGNVLCCRLKIIAILTNFFRSVIALSPDELVKCVYLCLNKVSSVSRAHDSPTLPHTHLPSPPSLHTH